MPEYSSELSTNDTITALQEQGQFLALSRKQGERFAKPLEFELANGTQVKISAAGIISFIPLGDSKKAIVLSCGVHGNETAPIEICDLFVQQILTGKMKLANSVLFLFANLPAMDIAQRFIEVNMNRLFSGAHSKRGKGLNFEQERAKLLEQEVIKFYHQADKGQKQERYHYDLHTAIRSSKNEKFAVYPFRHQQPWIKQQLQILLACGINTILLSGSPTTTFSYFSSNECGAHAFTVELGKVMPFGQNDMRKFSELVQTLGQLMRGEDLQLGEYKDDDFLIYQVNQVINKQAVDFKLHFADDAPNFTDFPKGAVLASEAGMQYVAQQDGEAIVFPNAGVEIGQRALLTVVPTTI